MLNFPWSQQLSLNSGVTWQTKMFTETLLNIMSNFIPNEIKRLFLEIHPVSPDL